MLDGAADAAGLVNTVEQPLGSICAVVVSHNRRDLLSECLAALLRQTFPIDAILVVDNASSDGTPEMLQASFPSVKRLRLGTNRGGAGGFRAGIEWAHAQAFDWFLLMDDDTVAEPSCVEHLMAALRAFGSEPRPAMLASRVLWTDGSLHRMNKPVPRASDVATMVATATARTFPVRFSTFVSMLLHRSAVDDHGLPLEDYFIWSDDVEYSARVLRRGLGVCVPGSIVVHKTASNYRWLDAPPERFYFHVRNSTWMLLKSSAFAWNERIVRSAKFVVGCLVYAARSRSLLRTTRALMNGLADGLFTSPRR
jgi:rhamnopyranosyl-N-acetylglucosaminyl-diphospho-decaprenol beta-1,3/1,4-galactofuranosyltransferase